MGTFLNNDGTVTAQPKPHQPSRREADSSVTAVYITFQVPTNKLEMIVRLDGESIDQAARRILLAAI